MQEITNNRGDVVATIPYGFGWKSGLEKVVREGSITGAIIPGRDLRGVDFSYTNLPNITFNDCILDGANFTRSFMRGAEFRRCVLTNASLKDMNATDTQFSYTDLTGSSMNVSEFDGASLVHCTFRNTSLQYAGVRWASLSNNHGIIDAGQDFRGHRFIGVRYDDCLYVQAGCRWFTWKDAVLHWYSAAYLEEWGDRITSDCRARLNMIVNLAKHQGWTI